MHRFAVVEGCLLLEVAGEPVVKMRPRWSGRSHSMRTPAKTQAYEQTVGDLAAWGWGRRPKLDGAVVAHRLFIFPRPGRLHRRKDPEGLIWKPTRPDEDNLSKALVDGLQLGGVVVDDGRIVHGLCGKAFAEKCKGSEPRALLAVGPLALMLERPPLYTATVEGPQIAAWWMQALTEGRR